MTGNKALVAIFPAQDVLSQSSGSMQRPCETELSLKGKDQVTHCFWNNLFLGLPNLERNPERDRETGIH